MSWVRACLWWLVAYLSASRTPVAAASSEQSESPWRAVLEKGSLFGFPTYSQAGELLDRWMSEHPDILQRRDLGKSFQGRPIHAYVLGVTAAPGAVARPQVLLTALIHAREPATLSVVLYFLGRTLELYAQGEAQSVYTLRHREVWIIPFINPDGYAENEKRGRKSAMMVRKNMNPTCPREPSNSGVDLNANFGHHWQKEEFPSCHEAYAGEAAFSEPETQAVKNACDKNNFKLALNFHAYGGMLVYPFNWARTTQQAQLPPKDAAIYREIARQFGWAKSGPVRPLLHYSANGEADDWMYAAKGIIAMAPEVGPESGGFWPPSSTIPGIMRRNFARIRYALLKVGLQLTLSWKSSSDTAPAAVMLAQGRPQDKLATFVVTMQNIGLTTRAGGLAMALEVSGSGLAGFDGLSVVETGQLQATLQSRGDGGNMTASFRLGQALDARSATEFFLVFSSTSAPPVDAQAFRLRACISERDDREETAAVCQCVGPFLVSATEQPQHQDLVSASEPLCAQAATVSVLSASHPLQQAAASPLAGQGSVASVLQRRNSTLPLALPLVSAPRPLGRTRFAPQPLAAAAALCFCVAAIVFCRRSCAKMTSSSGGCDEENGMQIGRSHTVGPAE